MVLLCYPQWLNGNSIVPFCCLMENPWQNSSGNPGNTMVYFCERGSITSLCVSKNTASQYCPNSKYYHGTLRQHGNTSLVNCNKRGSVPVLCASIMHHNKQLQCKNRKKRIKRARERIRSFMTLHFGPLSSLLPLKCGSPAAWDRWTPRIWSGALVNWRWRCRSCSGSVHTGVARPSLRHHHCCRCCPCPSVHHSPPPSSAPL